MKEYAPHSMKTLGKEALEEARIPRRFWKLGKDDYFGCPSAQQQVAHYIRSIGENAAKGVGLFFRGQQDSGKTFLMTLALRELMALGQDVFYFRLNEIVDAMLDPTSEARKFSPKFFSASFAGIDDVHAFRSDVHKEKFRQVIKSRIDDGHPTFVSTSLVNAGGVDDFAVMYGEEIADLITNNCITVKCKVSPFEMQRHYLSRKAAGTFAEEGEQDAD